jgi:diguanylate cyclase (GGDEF)-like protein
MSAELTAEEKIAQLEVQLGSALEEIEQLKEANADLQREKRLLKKQLCASTERVSRLSVQLVEEQEKNRELEVHALVDRRTGLYNAHYAEIQAARLEKAKSSRYLCVITIDIDYLKRINDELGHDAGNQLLVSFAKKLQEFPGEGKTVFRIGGDEFLIFKAKNTEAEAIEYSEMIRKTLNDGYDLTIEGFTFKCKASVGYSIGLMNGKLSYKKMYIAADSDMYKNKGMNR